MDNLVYGLLGLVGFAHPLHPVMITMVVGPVIAAFILGLIAVFFKKPDFFKTVRQLTVLSFIFWFPTVAIGIVDWYHFYGGSPKMIEIIIKLVLAGILFVVLLANIILFRSVKKDSLIPVVLMGVATLLVSALGFYGGDIVFGGSAKSAETSSAPSTPTAVSADGFKKLETKGYTVQWKVDGANVTFKVSYATNGWVGIGFGKTGTMEGSHIIIGFVLDGKAVIEDHFGYARDKHGPESQVGGKDSLLSRSGTYDNKITTITFSMPLNTGNPKDPVLVAGESYKVILANGGDDAADLVSYHGRDGRIIIDLVL